MDDDRAERERLYSETRTDLLTRQLSNSEKLDGAILTLSTAALGVSIAFIHNVVSLDKAQSIYLLKISWCLFGFSIVSTLVSFIVSQFGIKTQLYYAKEYYLNNNQEYLTKPNTAAKWTDHLNYISAFLFIAALFFTISFVILNLGDNCIMSKKETKITTKENIAAVPPPGGRMGATIPTMRPATGKKLKDGAPIPTMQPVSEKPQQTGTSTSGAGTGSQSGSGQSGQSSQGSKD
jgi:hypothetical protein